MLKKKALQVVLSGALITSIVAAPFTVNFERLTSFAKEDERVYSQPVDILTFISSSETSKKIDHIKGSKKDETLDKLKDKVKKNALKVNSIKLSGKLDKANKNLAAESTDLAANVEDVRKDADLQAYLQDALQQGKRVYLYGALTTSEYKELLNLDEIKLKSPSGEGYLSFGETPEEVAKEKGPLKPGAVSTEEESSIIGFTLDQNEERQFIDVSISSYDDLGKLSKNAEETYIQNIMAEQADLIEMDEFSVDSDETAFISENKASAEPFQVNQSYGSYAIGTYGSKTVARVDMDWALLKESKDNSSTYDYFTLTPTTQANSYNGGQATTIFQDIDIPSDNDHLQKWTPQGDNTESSFTLQMGFPYAISFGMTFSDATKVDDQSSLANDWARWNVTDANLDDEVFLGSAGWASAGTYAYAFYKGRTTVYVGDGVKIPVYASKTVTVAYNY